MMLDEKMVLERVQHLERPNARLIDARQAPDGSVEVFLDSESTPSFKAELVVTRLKGVDKPVESVAVGEPR
jgi:hypothetical protein